MVKILSAASWVGAIVLASSLAVVMPALAQTGPVVSVQGGIENGANGGAWRGGVPAGGGILGTVTTIDGNTITVTSSPHTMRPMPERATSTPVTSVPSAVYTVDATNAKIYKGSPTSTVSISAIAVGDMLIVQGTVNGTNITANIIRDGVVPTMGRPGMGGKGGFGHGTSSAPTGTAPIQGNGEPVIGGSVTGISGTTLTVTNASNVTYTIDAASTTIIKNGMSTPITNIAVGDNVIVQGVVNGNAVTASSVIDQGVKGTNGSSTNSSSTKPQGSGGFGFGGIFSAIGGFFQHLFGF